MKWYITGKIILLTGMKQYPLLGIFNIRHNHRILKGNNTSDIAEKLFISIHTGKALKQRGSCLAYELTKFAKAFNWLEENLPGSVSGLTEPAGIAPMLQIYPCDGRQYDHGAGCCVPARILYVRV